MKILITGGFGLIGHNVVKKLEELGHYTVIMDNRTDYRQTPVADLDYLLRLRRQKIKTNHVYALDIVPHGDINWVDHIIDKHQIDTIIHLASYPRQKLVTHDPINASRTMIEGLLNILEVARKRKIKKIVYISSSMVYGDFVDQVREDAICNPQGQYGIMKLAGEMLVKDYYRSSNINYTIIRPSAVYGPLDVEDRVVAKFILSAMNDGVLKVNGANELLDFTYVDDAAEGIVAATLSDSANNKTYNITKSHSHTLLDAAKLAIKIVGKGKIEVREKDLDFPSRGALNIDAARKDFGFNPKVDVEEGFEKYYQWLQDSPFWTSKTIR
jgi:nucleoside-diphosphate-sugar epimerase